MAKYKFNAASIKAVTEKLKRKVNAIKQETAFECSEYLLDFGYHSILQSGPGAKNGPGWTGYYAANWNVALNSPDLSVITPERDLFDEPAGTYLADLYSKQGNFSVVGKAVLSDTIFVTNSVYYGKWLNDGGFDFQTFTKESNPNRFLELCHAHLEKNISIIVKKVSNKVK